MVYSLPKNQRNQHIQACLRRDVTSTHDQLSSNVHYCHWCFNWVVGFTEWQEHCRRHTRDLGSKRCGRLTYCHTLVRPGYCPFCLGNGDVRSWCRDTALWEHVDGHLKDKRWPQRCPHPLCDVSLADGQDLRFHFIDDHGFSRALPKTIRHLGGVAAGLVPEQRLALKRKKLPEDEHEFVWLSDDQISPSHLLKKARRHTATITPSHLLRVSDSQDDAASVIDLTSLDSPTLEIKASPLPDKECDARLLDDREYDLKPPVRFRSCDTTLIGSANSDAYDDNSDGHLDLFSQYIRSPSPELVTTVDTKDVTTARELSSTQGLPPISSQPSLPQRLGAERDGRKDEHREPPGKIRIRLRVEAPPKPSIVLRIPASERKLPKPKPKPKTRPAKPARRKNTTSAHRPKRGKSSMRRLTK